MAACSLAVTVGGSILERKRPFTLLRLSGTSGATLYRVVVLESVLPLVSASLVAAATGIGVAIPLVKALPKLENEPNLALPGVAYYVAMAAGLVVALDRHFLRPAASASGDPAQQRPVRIGRSGGLPVHAHPRRHELPGPRYNSWARTTDGASPSP